VEPELVLINALNTWFGSVVGCETFHADVHAGNLLVLPDGRVGFIDFGIVGCIRCARRHGAMAEEWQGIAAIAEPWD
jgi:predicted unusual protein kinase regulating ubiquinone biosynthesis (AarF/ABC1/UbiB family)